MHPFQFLLSLLRCFLLLTSFFRLVSYSPPSLRTTLSPPPRLAYFISSKEYNAEALKRVLLAVYHHHNVYAVYCDIYAKYSDKKALRDFIKNHPVFSRIGNVKMITTPPKPYCDDVGLTKAAYVIHGAKELLKEGCQWDWFINLDAYGYPLVTQDDLLYAMSKMPRNLNFIDGKSHVHFDHDSHLSGRKVKATDYVLCTDSPWMLLTRSFIQHCMYEWYHLPHRHIFAVPSVEFRYQTIFQSSPTTYFRTVFRNALQFQNTTIRTDPHHNFTAGPITLDDHRCCIPKTKAPFARINNVDVLDWIDENLLSRSGPNTLVPGGWCDDDFFLKVGQVTNLKPGNGARELEIYLSELVNAQKRHREAYERE